MSREIRRVPLDWKHPENESCPHLNGLDWSHKRHSSSHEFQYGKCFRPILDKDFDTALQDWINEYKLWKNGEHPNQEDYSYQEYAGHPPNPEDYRPAWTPKEAIGYQIYETVSEGTPISPVFEILDEMKEWLLSEGYSEFASQKFIEDGWAPSMVFTSEKGVSAIGIHSLDHLDNN